jgi:hypothetical protein
MSISIDITKDLATPALDAVRGQLTHAKSDPVIGRAVRQSFKDWFEDLNRTRGPSVAGGTRTGFYGQAARATDFTLNPTGVTIGVSKVGIAQRYFGGEIRPVNRSYLAIPIRPEAYGHVPADFENLEVVFGANRRPIGLAITELTQNPHVGKKNKINVGLKQKSTGTLLFLFTKLVVQAADETVIPPKESTKAVAVDAVQKQLDTMRQRGWKPE